MTLLDGILIAVGGLSFSLLFAYGVGMLIGMALNKWDDRHEHSDLR